ncbi:hypothetical protein [Limnohabitans sp. INBF002]|uniref:hypothetical protein n=1 Tax=Limnohabitans sp. INBF002 TaxID=2986280 RepID=UPI0023775FC7|nr:hypothetical protein [Limnohabitans sp. INBF002]BDU52706.1 hypothetical protein LINBF2_09410 [Limnohabitans sp. INBF002]
MQQPPERISSASLPLRSRWGLLALVVLTIGSLAVAWLLPDMTMLHFLWVAQAVPILYFLLAWWGTQASERDDHAP